MKNSSPERQEALSKFWLARQLVWHFGWGWVAYRVKRKLASKAGLTARRTPLKRWKDLPLNSLLKLAEPDAEPAAYFEFRRDAADFLFCPADRPAYCLLLEHYNERAAESDLAQPLEEPPQVLAEAIAEGQQLYFARHLQDIGYPPEWLRFGFSRQRLTAEKHFTQLTDFPAVDIKQIWELSRFNFVFPLLRASWSEPLEKQSHDYAEIFWQLVESWRQANPPHAGPNWLCGQETSLRAINWLFGLFGFFDAPATRPERVALLSQMLVVSGQRIAATLDYALSQQNNHGVSEAAGLFLLGTLLPEAKESERWRKLGRRYLEELARTLLYDDGACTQHSVNYQRMMLDLFVLSIRIAKLNMADLSDEMVDRVGRSAELLYQLQDATTGRLPNHGPNDGSLALPLSCCDIADYRPSLGTALAVTRGIRPYENGPWYEALLWHLGPAGLELPRKDITRVSFAAQPSGYVCLRGDDSFLVTRCTTYRHRPSHADLLHVDLWHRGYNLAIDAGTYSYHTPGDDPPPWDTTLAGTAVHNTVTVDGRHQMRRAGKFLWLPWAPATGGKLRTSENHRLEAWEGSHAGYRELDPAVVHRRGLVRLPQDHWLIVDALPGSRPHDFRLHWLLADVAHQLHPPAEQAAHLEFNSPFPYHLRIATLAPAEFSLARAEETTDRGWHAPNYRQLEPALSMAAVQHAETACFATLAGPTAAQLELTEDEIRIGTHEWQATVQYNATAPHLPLLAHIQLTGDEAEELS